MFGYGGLFYLLRSGKSGGALALILMLAGSWLFGLYVQAYMGRQVLTELSRDTTPEQAYWDWVREEDPSLRDRARVARQYGLAGEAERLEAQGSSSGEWVAYAPIPGGLVLAALALVWFGTREQRERLAKARATKRALSKLEAHREAGVPEGEAGIALAELPTPGATGEVPIALSSLAPLGPTPSPAPSTVRPTHARPGGRASLEEIRATQEIRERDAAPRVADLAREDDAFSVVGLHELILSLHRAVARASVSGDWSALLPFVTPGVRRYLTEASEDVIELGRLSLGPAVVTVAEAGREWTRLELHLASVRHERTRAGMRQVAVDEVWELRRSGSATSLEPAQLQALACPSCGSAPVSVDGEGRCTSCRMNISWGQFSWQVSHIEIKGRRPLGTPRPTWQAPNPDHASAGSRVSNTLAGDLDSLARRRPEFDPERFFGRVAATFAAVQDARTAGDALAARPYLHDLALGTLRNELDTWAAAGLRQRTDDVELQAWELVKVTVDPWYVLVTVRLTWSGVERVLGTSGEVVGGRPGSRTVRTAYWTFTRATGLPEHNLPPDRCAACGEPLDRVDAEGVCGYCESDLASLDWDWMLLRVDRFDRYEG